jgi:hypothetical protein
MRSQTLESIASAAEVFSDARRQLTPLSARSWSTFSTWPPDEQR